MRIASFNVENMFCRAAIMNRKDWIAGQPVLERFAKLNALICLDTYDQQVKAEMLQLLIHVGLEKRDESRWGHPAPEPRASGSPASGW